MQRFKANSSAGVGTGHGAGRVAGRDGRWSGRNSLWEQRCGGKAGAVPCHRLVKLPPR